MAQIPRQFLRPGRIASTGRRSQEVAQATPGSQDRLEAITLANDRGLDLTGVGEALYKGATAFVEMEKKRKAEELKLQQIKQESAARSVNVELTQKIQDKFEEVRALQIADPTEARNAFYSGVQEEIGAYNEVLDGIGPFAKEAAGKRVAELLEDLGPQVTKQAFELSTSQLQEELSRTARREVATAARMDDDAMSAQAFEDALDNIAGAEGVYLSKFQTEQHMKYAAEEYMSQRFRKKFAVDPHGAMSFIYSNTDLDPKVRHKIISETAAELNAMNSAHEAMSKAQEKAAKQTEDENYEQAIVQIDQLEESGDLEAIAKLRDDVQKHGPKAFSKTGLSDVLSRIEDALNPDPRDSWTSQTGEFFQDVMYDQRLTTSQKDRIFRQHRNRLSPDERTKWYKERKALQGADGERRAAIKRDLHRNLKLQVLAQAGIGAVYNEDGEFDFAASLTGNSAERARVMGLVSQASQIMEGKINGILDAGGNNRDNLNYLEQNQTNILASTVDMVAPAVKAKRGTLEVTKDDLAMIMNMASVPSAHGRFAIDPGTANMALDHYKATQKAKDPNWTWQKDEQVLNLNKLIWQPLLAARKKVMERMRVEPPESSAEAPAPEPEPTSPEPEPAGGPPEPSNEPFVAQPELAREVRTANLGFEPTIDNAIAQAAEAHGVDHDWMRIMAEIESGGNPDAKNPRSSATGLYQFIEKSGEGFGIFKKGEFDDRRDPVKSADAAARMAVQNKRILERAGMRVEPWVLYMAHQQGVGGVRELYQLARTGEDPSPDMREKMDLNGGEGMTPGEFLDHWKNKWARLEARYTD